MAAKPAGKNRELIKAQKGSYEVTKPLATGTFGSVYRAKRESDGKLFAVKCESLKMKHSLLRQASMVLASIQFPSQYFVSIEERGTVPGRFLFVVMPLYGDNLLDLMVKTAKKFSVSSSLHLADQTLEAIRDLHRNGFVHRDIKPTHFCIGLEEAELHHNVYLIDFGLCKRPPKFTKKGDEADEKLRKGAILYRGVVRYASLNAHAGKELGFRDDMESWWYMVLEFFLGALPWAYLNKQNERDVVNMKISLNEQMVSSVWKIQKDAITTFFDMLNTIRSVNDINEFVDYNRIHDSIKTMFEKTGANPVEPPDWDCLSDYKGPNFQPVNMISVPEPGNLKEAEFVKTDAEGSGSGGGGGGASKMITLSQEEGKSPKKVKRPEPKGKKTKGKAKKNKNRNTITDEN